MLTDEYRYKLLRQLSDNPEISQRELAKALGISLGKVNFCLKALVDVGLVKVENFRNNPKKSGYLYLLTPTGIEQKSSITKNFLQRKIDEHKKLTNEIERLREEVAQQNMKLLRVNNE